MKNHAEKVAEIKKTLPPDAAWRVLSQEVLSPEIPFSEHLAIFSELFPDWQTNSATAPLWQPDANTMQKTHLAILMQQQNIQSLDKLHRWTVNHRDDFLALTLKNLAIKFSAPAQNICDLSAGVTTPRWLPNAKLNIAESCFNANPAKTALITQKKNGMLQTVSYGDLNKLSNQVANSLVKNNFKTGDAIAIDMPMTTTAVAIYLGIIKMGGVVVSIADSFSADEIATRLRIAKAKGIFTQDFILRDEKKLPLYQKVCDANAPRAMVIPCDQKITLPLREQDLAWDDFLVSNQQFSPIALDPMAHCNILFSSGTTGDPKAIPWNHTTPIKAAADAFYHHDLNATDIIAWPTNLGWMMGPWVIFAAFINQATVALYEDAPRGRDFGQFIQDAKVTVLGVVPTLVATWRQTQCMQGLDWHHIKLFTSTGECSNPEDMFYLSHLAGYKPIIEYCGGTEIGGAYVTSTLLENNYPSIFTTPALGLDFVLLDEKGQTSDLGEVALVPPALGLSTELLNADHQKIYFTDMPKTADGKILRRHGDQLQRVADRRYCVLGRVDDTMNLGAIKVSSAEIERVLAGMDDIVETAAIAVNGKQLGPSLLVIYAATQRVLDKASVQNLMQKRINQHLNPLFKIHDVVFVNELPKTASNKIMRRVLRGEYGKTV